MAYSTVLQEFMLVVSVNRRSKWNDPCYYRICQWSDVFSMQRGGLVVPFVAMLFFVLVMSYDVVLMGKGYKDLLGETPSHSHSSGTPPYNYLAKAVVIDDF